MAAAVQSRGLSGPSIAASSSISSGSSTSGVVAAGSGGGATRETRGSPSLALNLANLQKSAPQPLPPHGHSTANADDEDALSVDSSNVSGGGGGGRGGGGGGRGDDANSVEEGGYAGGAEVDIETAHQVMGQHVTSTTSTSAVGFTHAVAGLPPTAQAIARRLSRLGRTASGSHIAYLDVDLSGMELSTVADLASYVHLQGVSVSHNALTTLAPLSSLRYLVSLDASHNALTTALDLDPPPYNLLLANLSANAIESLPSLAAHRFLQTLLLDDNEITTMSGLSELSCLTCLSLRNNRIEFIDGIEGLPLKELHLSGNALTYIDNISTLTALEILSIDRNDISSLSGLEDHPFLCSVDASSNNVEDITAEVESVKDLKLLRSLSLADNPVTEEVNYRSFVIFMVPQLLVLDDVNISIKDKVVAINVFDPPDDVIESREHAAEYEAWLEDVLRIPPPLGTVTSSQQQPPQQ